MYKKLQQEQDILKNIVAKIQSNEKQVRKEMDQLRGRVDRLEINSNHHVVRRQASKASNLTSACPKKCAFDFPASTDPKYIAVIPGNMNNISIMKNPPSNCNDLKEVGYILSGYYPVKQGRKMNLVFCNFTTSSVDGIIGL